MGHLKGCPCRDSYAPYRCKCSELFDAMKETAMPRSFKPVFQVGNDPKWYDNRQRFATEEEAAKSANSRWVVWTLANAYMVEPSDDPVNYRWDDRMGDVRLNEA